jgi:threonine/homoserine efflux transporter RhtA
MTQGIVGLLGSKRGVFCLLLTLIATAMTLLGKLTADQWVSYTQWVGTILVAGHTVSHAVELLKPASPPSIPEARATPPG